MDDEYRVYGFTKAGVAITDPYFAELMRDDDFAHERCAPAPAEVEEGLPEPKRYERAHRPGARKWRQREVADPLRSGPGKTPSVRRKKPAYMTAVGDAVREKFKRTGKTRPPRSHPWSAGPVVQRDRERAA